MFVNQYTKFSALQFTNILYLEEYGKNLTFLKDLNTLFLCAPLRSAHKNLRKNFEFPELGS